MELWCLDFDLGEGDLLADLIGEEVLAGENALRSLEEDTWLMFD